MRKLYALYNCVSHYRRALGALLVYDITKEPTFANIKNWLENLRQHAEQDICIMLVGNKLDLVTSDLERREVPREAAESFAREENLFFMETSAQTNNNVRDAFEALLNEIYNLR